MQRAYSYSFAAQSLLAAIASIQFVSNVFFGALILKEKVTSRVKKATAVIVGGNIFVVTFASREGSSYTTEELKELYDERFKIFGLCMLGLVGVLQIIYRYYQWREDEGRPLPRSHITIPVLYACVGAMIGTQCVVQAKSLSTLLHASWIDGENQLDKGFTWIVLGLWVVGTLFWCYRVARALKQFDGLFIIPVLQAFFVFWTIVVGGVFFREFDEFTWGQSLGFILGVLTVLFGVFMLAPPRESTNSVHSEDGESVDDFNPMMGKKGNPDQHGNGRVLRQRSSSELAEPPVPMIGTPLDKNVAETIDLIDDAIQTLRRQNSQGMQGELELTALPSRQNHETTDDTSSPESPEPDSGAHEEGVGNVNGTRNALQARSPPAPLQIPVRRTTSLESDETATPSRIIFSKDMGEEENLDHESDSDSPPPDLTKRQPLLLELKPAPRKGVAQNNAA